MNSACIAVLNITCSVGIIKMIMNELKLTRTMDNEYGQARPCKSPAYTSENTITVALNATDVWQIPKV